MDQLVRIQFFHVDADVNGAQDFSDILLACAQHPDRERDLFGGVLFRLHQAVDEDGFIVGEFARRQMENIPPEATQDAIEPLPIADDSGIGHMAAFAYDPIDRVLALQMNRRCASANRIAAYLRIVNQTWLYSLSPIASGDAWERFNSGRPRRISFGISNAQAVRRIEGQENGLLSTITNQALSVQGTVVRVEISVGRERRSFLDRTAVTRAIAQLTGLRGGDSDVTNLRVASKPEDGGSIDEIDFLEEFLSEQDNFTLPKDPLQNYNIRKTFAKLCLQRQKATGALAR